MSNTERYPIEAMILVAYLGTEQRDGWARGIGSGIVYNTPVSKRLSISRVRFHFPVRTACFATAEVHHVYAHFDFVFSSFP